MKNLAFHMKYIWGVHPNSNKMRHVTIIGKPGCMKCSKMEIILKNRGCETDLTYIETIGKQNIKDIEVEVSEETHFPLFIYNGELYNNYSVLNKELNGYTRNEC